MREINLPVEERVYRQVIQFMEDDVNFVPFKITKEEYNKTLFILIHGADDGDVLMGNVHISTKELLEGLIAKGLTSDEIDVIYTISCYGGMQETVTINGITISSCHDYKEPIYVSVRASIDEQFWVQLLANE